MHEFVVTLSLTLVAALMMSWMFAAWRFGRARSLCCECRGPASVIAFPHASRLVIHCQSPACGQESVHSVRASALSMFGLTSLLLTIICSALSFMLASSLGLNLTIQVLAASAGIVFGVTAVRFVVRLAAWALLKSNLSLGWQEEIVAHLAPPPWTVCERD